MSRKGGHIEALGIVLPGDKVLQLDSEDGAREIFLGPGLRRHENAVYATCSGPLKKTTQNIYYIDNYQKRYNPLKGQFVVGIVYKKKGDNYIIDIGASEYATLSLLCFENLPKKARTKIRPGELIFGQLLVAEKNMEPELVCVDMSNDSVGISALPEGGLMFTVPLHVARRILDPQNTLLKKVSTLVECTLVVGSNGRVWVWAKEQRHMLAIMNCLKMLEVMTQQEAEQKASNYFNMVVL
ncbi:Exosome complex component RRP40 [Chionoecetes opilio]|uniref:Exosome complex component RRP40 n=1 Tax=Chionoecetes opilio TaxID=41210 RepID=A0A8J5CZL5_CHIOP|nr:Exosome complex component RRP40 [Chionoecetes opilio]